MICFFFVFFCSLEQNLCKIMRYYRFHDYFAFFGPQMYRDLPFVQSGILGALGKRKTPKYKQPCPNHADHCPNHGHRTNNTLCVDGGQTQHQIGITVANPSVLPKPHDVYHNLDDVYAEPGNSQTKRDASALATSHRRLARC